MGGPACFRLPSRGFHASHLTMQLLHLLTIASPHVLIPPQISCSHPGPAAGTPHTPALEACGPCGVREQEPTGPPASVFVSGLAHGALTGGRQSWVFLDLGLERVLFRLGPKLPYFCHRPPVRPFRCHHEFIKSDVPCVSSRAFFITLVLIYSWGN